MTELNQVRTLHDRFLDPSHDLHFILHFCRFLDLFQWCAGAPSTTPFGVDPVFIPASSLYSVDVEPRVSQFYFPEELNAQSIPRGFFPKETKVRPCIF
jgi:hypothetical protein